MALNKELLGLLACPKCKGGLTLTDRRTGPGPARPARLVYPIRDEIPIMLVEEAVEPGKNGEKEHPGL